MKDQMMKMKDSSTMPSPSNINMWWNLGSMLGLMLSIQISTGIILSMNYCPNINEAFKSIIMINNNNEMGWYMRNMHANGASIMFMMMYMHVTRGIYFLSFKKSATWMAGIGILISCMASAFLGYVLPWGQMSLWGATVITNLMSAIPYIGEMMVQWMWGGPSINNATLNRFYSLHFILPFIMLTLVLIHLSLLHNSGSSNPMGLKSFSYMIPLSPYFMLKDYLGFMMMLITITYLTTENPFLFADPDNYIPANIMQTPKHIKPEWYFLFAYSILRSIPNKLGGVMCLMMSILILAIMPLYKINKPSMKFNPITQIMFWLLMSSLIILTWTGGSPVEYPYTSLAQMASLMYFSFFMIMPLMMNLWKK